MVRVVAVRTRSMSTPHAKPQRSAIGSVPGGAQYQLPIPPTRIDPHGRNGLHLLVSGHPGPSP
jgi:hypothetical protein